LYFSAAGATRASLGAAVTGHDGSVALAKATELPSSALRERFKWVASGPVFQVPANEVARVPDLLCMQLALVQEDAGGRVLNATSLQIPGA
jgi:hypothetical protein